MAGSDAGEERRRAATASVAIPPDLVHDFFAGIHLQVENVKFMFAIPDVGGLCIFKTLAAYQAVRACGINVAIGIGGLVARVGHDELRDMVAFCGRYNQGAFVGGDAAFHCWLRYQHWIFDASVGEWAAINKVRTELETFGKAREPIQWSIALPSYWLRPAAELERGWHPEGTPQLGEAWYTPFRGDVVAVRRRIREAHKDVGQQIATGLAHAYNANGHGINHKHGDQVYPLIFGRGFGRDRA